MSRVGKLPVKVPETIKIEVDNNKLTFDNSKVKKTYEVMLGVKITYKDNEIKLTAENTASNVSKFVGMDRSNINNIIQGLQESFKTTLEVNGVGYKALVQDRVLILTLGYSHEIFYALPEGITAVFEKPNLIILSGDDKVLVGQVASEIISFRKPEPYKGKGVKIQGKQILRKEGKKK